MDSGSVIYVPSFIKIGLGIQKLIGGDTQTHTHTRRQQRDLISLLYFFQNEESGLKISFHRLIYMITVYENDKS
jgi:hypothetical protein